MLLLISPEVSDCSGGRGSGGPDRFTTAFDVGFAVSPGEEPVTANAHESLRQPVLQKTTKELDRTQRELPRFAAAPVVLPVERHLVVFEAKEPLVRDCDAMGVPREIAQYLLRPAKRTLGVDDPGLLIRTGHQPLERTRLGRIR